MKVNPCINPSVSPKVIWQVPKRSFKVGNGGGRLRNGNNFLLIDNFDKNKQKLS